MEVRRPCHETLHIITVVLISLTLCACSTTGHFNVPEDSNLYLYRRPVSVPIDESGTVTVNHFYGQPQRYRREGEFLTDYKRMEKQLKKAN